MTYEELLIDADDAGIVVKEKKLNGSNGRVWNNRVAIRRSIPTSVEKSCVLAEEIGHYYTSSGDITRLGSIESQKQELKARLYGYNLKIGLVGIIKAYQYGCRNRYEMADFLDVTEEYLTEAINCYRSKYGKYVLFDNYTIYFEPYFGVLELKSAEVFK